MIRNAWWTLCNGVLFLLTYQSVDTKACLANRSNSDEEPTSGDSLREERAPCPFCGDNLSAPPLAWTLIWGGTYSNLYDWYTGDELRQWAYVFWDGVRLRKYGGDDFLAKQWEQSWWEDPRQISF